MSKITLEDAVRAARARMNAAAPAAEQVAEATFGRVLEAFRTQRVSVTDFAPTSGYGYNDAGRDKLEAIYAQVFGAEAALVRQQIVSGSHAIALALLGNLLPGDHLVTLGLPYDTLQTVMGLNRPVPGSLAELGVSCTVLDVDFTDLHPGGIAAALPPQTKMLAIQRSRGYSLRPSLCVAQIKALCAAVKQQRPETLIFVDNCYGEFVEHSEPLAMGADLIAGSLIKNPGAGIAPGGGYVAGRAELVERAAVRLTVPGAGRELGASLTDNRPFYQALFLAPQIVLEAKLSAVFIAALCEQLGFSVSPRAVEPRADIIQTVSLGNRERLLAFCRGIQKYSPIDSQAAPEPWPMPGYDCDIIMASGSFVSGSSIELSADAPLREPYCVFVQGGLNRYHTIYAVSRTLADMQAAGLLEQL